jgi:tight adherence protein C
MEYLFHNQNFLATLAGGGAFAVVVLIWMALVEGDPLPERLKHVTERRSELREQQKQKKTTRRPEQVRTDFAKRIVQKLKLEQGKKLDELRVKLAQAGYRSRDTLFTYLFMKLALPIGGAFGGFFCIFVLHTLNLTPFTGLCGVLFCGGFGFLLPDIMLKNQSQKRQTVLRKSLPDALDLMVICAEAGLSLDSSLDRVSREIGPSCAELAEEIGLTGVELGFYPDRAKALQNFADRVPLQGAIALTNTLIQTERYGTPLAQALRVLSAEMREERMMAAEAKAAKLPATLTVPMILFILPPLFVVLIGPAALKVAGLSAGH